MSDVARGGLLLLVLLWGGCTGGPISDFPSGATDEEPTGGDGDVSASLDGGRSPGDDGVNEPPSDDASGLDAGLPSDAGAADAGDAGDAGDVASDASTDASATMIDASQLDAAP